MERGEGGRLPPGAGAKNRTGPPLCDDAAAADSTEMQRDRGCGISAAAAAEEEKYRTVHNKTIIVTSKSIIIIIII